MSDVAAGRSFHSALTRPSWLEAANLPPKAVATSSDVTPIPVSTCHVAGRELGNGKVLQSVCLIDKEKPSRVTSALNPMGWGGGME